MLLVSACPALRNLISVYRFVDTSVVILANRAGHVPRRANNGGIDDEARNEYEADQW